MADGITRRFFRAILAIAGCLNPWIAVFAMVASSLTVTGNTLRISRPRDPELWV
jgi:cation transport ATPase